MESLARTRGLPKTIKPYLERRQKKEERRKKETQSISVSCPF